MIFLNRVEVDRLCALLAPKYNDFPENIRWPGTYFRTLGVSGGNSSAYELAYCGIKANQVLPLDMAAISGKIIMHLTNLWVGLTTQYFMAPM